jgi:hypothetical protein
MAVDWPDLTELKQVLDVTSEDWDGDDDDTRLTRLLSAAIDQTKVMVGGTVDAYDELYASPTAAHSQAALRVAELLATRPTAGPAGFVNSRPDYDPTIRRLLFGSRRRFGVA